MVNFETVHLKIECYIKSVNPSLNSRNFWCELMQAMARARAAATTGQHTGNMFCVRRFRGAGTFASSWWPRKQDPVTIMNKNICLESSSNLKIQCLVLTFFHRIWMNVSFIFFNFRQVCVVWSSPWRAPMRTTSRSMRQFYQWMLC